MPANIIRTQYLDRLLKHKDAKIIKVITGIRRCGKSVLLKQFMDSLLESGIKDEQITFINFEDIAFEHLLNYQALHDYICQKLIPNQANYVFLDEVQNVENFQKAVDSLFLKNNVDIYLTGSNAYMLSSELSTLLSGRYVEIQMLPLSFKEYFLARKPTDKKSCFLDYLKFTSLPYAARLNDSAVINDYLQGVYNSVLLKDVVKRKNISDISLLENLIKFLFDNIGSIVSPKSISDSLSSSGRKTSPITIENYIQALCDTFIIYKCARYDIKGKQYLKSLQKYYLADLGFRRLLLGDRNLDMGRILENIVYLELLRRGYRVNVGKIETREIDFIAQSSKEIIYFQVSQTISAAETLKRELSPLKSIKDNYKKIIIVMDEINPSFDGIETINILDFLLDQN